MAAIADTSPPPSSSSGTAITSDPNRSDQHLLGEVYDMFRRARGKRRGLVDRWRRNYDVLTNRNMWANRQDWLPAPALPEIYPIISSIVGWQTDQRIRFDAVPAAEQFSHTYNRFDQLSHDLRNVMNSTWENENYDTEITKLTWDAYLYGTGILKTLWDDRLWQGLGNATIKRVDPFTFYPDPEATSMDDATYFIEVKTLSEEEIEARWPGSLRKIRGNIIAEPPDQAPTHLSDFNSTPLKTQPSAAISPNTDPRYYKTNRVDSTETTGITIMECWMRIPAKDDAYPDIPAFDAAAHDNPYYDDEESKYEKGKERRFDTWRCVIVAGNAVLENCAADDLFAHGQHPYDRYVIDDIGEFWGLSMVEMLAPAQTSLNRLLAAMEQNIWLMGNPVFKESVRSGIRPTQLTNKPGSRLTVNDGGVAEWLQPPQMHPQIADTLMQFYIGEMERISGLSAIVRGATPTGRNAQGVLDSVQDAAFVRIRKAQRSLERTLASSLNKVASLICEFYDTPRITAIIGDDGNKAAVILKSLHWYMPSSEGRAPLRFSILVRGGSSLPTSHGQRAAEADTLFAMGAIDEEAVLDAHDWPDRAVITARVREMKAAAGMLGQPPGARQKSRR